MIQRTAHFVWNCTLQNWTALRLKLSATELSFLTRASKIRTDYKSALKFTCLLTPQVLASHASKSAIRRTRVMRLEPRGSQLALLCIVSDGKTPAARLMRLEPCGSQLALLCIVSDGKTPAARLMRR